MDWWKVSLPNMIFVGIPASQDLDIYRAKYYASVEVLTYLNYGEGATTADAVRSMDSHGNSWFYDSFPDVYKKKEDLGKKYQTSFKPVNDNTYANFIHGLTHIRSLSEQTPLGEMLLLPDQFYTINSPYDFFATHNMGRYLNKIDLPVHANKEHQLFKPEKWLNNTLGLINYYRGEYEEYYKDKNLETHFLGGRNYIGANFLANPENEFETKLSHNFVRTLFMDEKFKYYGSSRLPFIDTPVKTSSSEPASIVFSTEEENSWVKRIHDEMLTKGKTGVNQVMIDDRKGTHAERIATQTAKELMKYI